VLRRRRRSRSKCDPARPAAARTAQGRPAVGCRIVRFLVPNSDRRALFSGDDNAVACGVGEFVPVGLEGSAGLLLDICM
jgi:hypothetical protein